jgi:hypothetical protein
VKNPAVFADSSRDGISPATVEIPKGGAVKSVVRQKFRFLPARIKLSGAIAATVLIGTANVDAASQPFTFAQFEQATQSSDANEFDYVDNGASSDAELTTDNDGVVGVSIPVIFTYQTLNGTLPADLQGPQQATLTLTSSTTAGVSVISAFGKQLGDQQIFGNGNATDTLSITRDTPAAEGSGSMTNLLTMTFTGDLLGDIGSRTPTLSGSTTEGNTVTYTSDFITFSPSADDDFNMAFTSWTTTADGNGLEESGIKDDSYFASATAAGAATFDSTLTPIVTSIPEPAGGSVAAALGLLAVMLRRRRAARC